MSEEEVTAKGRSANPGGSPHGSIAIARNKALPPNAAGATTKPGRRIACGRPLAAMIASP